MKTGIRRIILFIATLAILGVLLSVGTVSAETLFYGPYELQNWSASGPGTTSISPSSGPAIQAMFNYNFYPSGYDWRTWTFSTTATETEIFSFNWQHTGMHCWHLSQGKAIVFADGPSGMNSITLWEGYAGSQFNKSGSASIQVYQGYDFGFKTMGKHFDSSNTLRGQLTITPNGPSGWDEGDKSGWDNLIPPGLDKNDKAPPGFDKGNKTGWD